MPHGRWGLAQRPFIRSCGNIASRALRSPRAWNTAGMRGLELLSRAFDGGHPAEEEKVPAAQEAAVRQENPVQRFFERVSDAYAPKFDRSAIRTFFGEHRKPRYTSVLAALPVPGALPPRNDWTG